MKASEPLTEFCKGLLTMAVAPTELPFHYPGMYTLQDCVAVKSKRAGRTVELALLFIGLERSGPASVLLPCNPC
jgi:hypothetical protein